MPTAIQTTTTPTRRSAMQFGVGALIAGITAPIMASAALSPDAELIKICDRLLRIKAAFNELFSRRNTVEQEDATEDELTALYDRKSLAVEELEELDPPTTLAGVKALARAALATHDGRNSDGEIESNCDSHWSCWSQPKA
jgi:hypothetical protein